ncbi:hypothetical protein MRX96_014363 [Rhipicephalus microplus]
MDTLVRVLPPLPGHSLDVCIDMRCISSSSDEIMPSEGAIYPGCLAHENSKLALQHIVNCKQKECMMELNRLIVEAALKLRSALGCHWSSNSRATQKQNYSIQERWWGCRHQQGPDAADLGSCSGSTGRETLKARRSS